MDYESRQVKWYWLFLFIVYCGGVGYLLFSGNPYLYSQDELRTALTAGSNAQSQTIPSEVPGGSAKPSAPTFHQRYNPGRTGVDPVGNPRGRSYEEYEKHEVVTGIPNWKPSHIAFDQTGFYTTNGSPWVVALNLDGKARWKFRFAADPGERGIYAPLLDEANLYAVHPTGEVLALDKKTGELRWLMPQSNEVIAQPFLWANLIAIPVKGPQGLHLVLVNRRTGKKMEDSPKLDIKPGFQIAFSQGLNLFIATVENKVVAIDPDEWTIAWTQTLTEPIRGPAVVSDKQIFVATLGAKIVNLDGSRKGKIDWETDLEKPASAPPTILPIMGRLSLVDSSGALVTLDAKKGKIYWRYGIDGAGSFNETWSARLKANNIEEFKMDWLHKGWTIWAPCGDQGVCIYTPLKGARIWRLNMSGRPLTLPLALENRYVFFTETKPGSYLISHQVEDGEVKRLRKEAADKAAAQ